MKIKKAFTILALFVASMLPAMAGNPESDNRMTYYIDNGDTEFEALFTVNGSDLVEKAKDYLGRPYRSGCKGPYAFDCSGFTSYVYKCMNISIGASSRDQWRQGLSVDRDDVHVGDLVFFGSSRNRIGHVGIVCEVEDDGNFKFIHSSTSRGVTISSIDDNYYSRMYRGVRRILEN